MTETDTSVRRQFLTLLVARGASGLAQAAVLVLVARWMQVADYGALMSWTGILLVACGLADVGISGYVLVERPKGNADRVRRALRLNVLTSVGGAVLLGAIGFLAAPDALALPFVLLAAAAFLEKNTDTLIHVAIADRDNLSPAVSILIRRLGNLALTPLLYLAGLDPAVAYGAGYVTVCAIAQWHARRVITRSVEPGPLEGAWNVLRHSLRFMVELSAGQARMLDAAVVAAVSGGTTAGVYAAGTRLANPFVIVAGTLGNVLTPHVSRGDDARARSIARRLALGTAGLVVVAVPVAILVAPLVVLLLGERYAESADVFAWALPAIVLIGMATPFAGFLQARGHATYVAIAAAANAVTLLTLVAIGAAWHGAASAAAGLATAAVIYVSVLAVRALRV